MEHHHHHFSASDNHQADNIITTTPVVRPNRRKFLKSAAVIAAGVGVTALPLLMAKDVSAANDFIVSSGFPSGGVFTSQVYQPGENFNAIGSYWETSSGDGNAVTLEIRTGNSPSTLGDWVQVNSDTFEGRVLANQSRIFGRVQFFGGSSVQFRANIPAGVTLKLIGLTFINSVPGPVIIERPQPATPPGVIPRPPIISRRDWGANESWRFSNGVEVWEQEYRTPKVVFVHHSETSNTNNPNPAADVRGIYQYHALTKGWGDIGYNYLVDWKGNIYEGRYGGDDVVGGHAYQYNYGSIGICLVGAFGIATPPKAMIDALVKLIAFKCSQKSINPLGVSFLIDKNLNNICGHRDGINTSCPGDQAYKQLPSVRTRVNDAVKTTDPGDFAIDLVSLRFSPTNLKAGERLKIEAVVKNTGTRPIETQDPPPNYVYKDGQNFETQKFDKQNQRFRLAIDFQGNGGVSHPYRWGFGKTLAPNEQVTVTGYIDVTEPRERTYSGGIVQEFVKYWEDQVASTKIVVSASQPDPDPDPDPDGNPTTPVPSKANGNSNYTYYPQTGHNLGYTFRRYWESNGGLSLFGFPLTDEFVEDSDTEPGKQYLVQYFERNRFEYHPENKNTPFEVLLGLLGVSLNEDRRFEPGAPIPITDQQIYFQETGHTLRGVFLRYWKARGGLAIFGYPISEEFDEVNRDDDKVYRVQYFERNRFEYHPENNGTQYEVLLGLLGKELCRRKGWIKD